MYGAVEIFSDLPEKPDRSGQNSIPASAESKLARRSTFSPITFLSAQKHPWQVAKLAAIALLPHHSANTRGYAWLGGSIAPRAVLQFGQFVREIRYLYVTCGCQSADHRLVRFDDFRKSASRMRSRNAPSRFAKLRLAMSRFDSFNRPLSSNSRHYRLRTILKNR
jgi:hypothetical protein